MTPIERLTIEWECTRLINLYANLNDAGRWEDLAALYVEDGLMTRPTAPNAPIVGREAILAAFKARPARVSQHICSNIVITVEHATSASGYSGIVLYGGRAAGDGPAIRDEAPPAVGFFRDRFALTSEGWRFTERRGGMTFA